ncbi:MAG TPA: hypothetical protein PLI96_06545 [Halothiobacillus sp.]|jgi:UDP-N-acetylglucosamine:LPS N-acetylglucosamine transferase|nr:hypothetical protein [Halothiobacillus sp.]HUN00124.1 hypothetical protein [Halothiobacillus sp.]
MSQQLVHLLSLINQLVQRNPRDAQGFGSFQQVRKPEENLLTIYFMGGSLGVLP